MLMATWKVAPAFSIGCPAILNPSELASLYVLIDSYKPVTSLVLCFVFSNVFYSQFLNPLGVGRNMQISVPL